MSRPGRNARQVRARIKRQIMPPTRGDVSRVPAILDLLCRASRRDRQFDAA